MARPKKSTNPARRRRRAEKTGRRAEWAAAMLLRLKGFSILTRRWKTPAGEIDLVARRGRLIVFAEVKARMALDDAFHAVTPRARRRIGAAAALFFADRPHLADCGVRYDMILVAGLRMRHVPDAWRDGE